MADRGRAAICVTSENESVYNIKELILENMYHLNSKPNDRIMNVNAVSRCKAD